MTGGSKWFQGGSENCRYEWFRSSTPLRGGNWNYQNHWNGGETNSIGTTQPGTTRTTLLTSASPADLGSEYQLKYQQTVLQTWMRCLLSRNCSLFCRTANP